MKNDTGNSGIDIIGNVTWGTHFCQFYQTEEDLMDVLVPYLKTGLENNELCIWVTPQFVEAKKAEQLLRIAFPGIDIYLKKGQIEILSCDEWYFRENTFDSQKALNCLADKVTQAPGSGYKGLRLVEDICRLEKESLNDFIYYEKKVDSVIDKYPVIALCTYLLETCNAADIVEIVSSHQFTLIKKEGKWEQIEGSGRENLTKLKLTTEAFRKSEERYRMLFTNMTEGFILAEAVYDEHGKPYDYRYLEINPVYERSTGLKKEQVLGKSILEVVPDVSPILIEKFGETAASGKSNYFEIFSQVTGKYFDTYVFSPERGKVAATFRDITARKQVEEALRESEARLRVIVANSPDTIFEQDRNLHYIWIYNPAPPLSVSDVIGKTDADLLPPDQAQRLESVKRRVLETGMREQALLQLSPGGEPRWFESVYEPRYDAEGQITGVLSYTRDVTERKRMEEALTRERSLLESIIHATDFMLALFDTQFNFLWVNPAYAKASHMKPEEMVGKNHFELYPHAENEAIFRKVRDSGKGVFYRDKPFVYPDQPERGVTYWDWSLQPVKNSGGSVIGLVLSLRETTERKQAEEALQQSRDTLQAIIDAAPIGIIVAKVDGKILLANANTQRILGGPITGDAHRPAGGYKVALPDGTPVHAGQLPLSLALEGHTVTDTELLITRDDGTQAVILASATPLQKNYGKPWGAVALLQDITERKQIEKKLQESEEEYRNIVETASEGIWIGDPEARTIYVNKRLTEMLGYSQDEMTGKFAWDFADEAGKPLIKKYIERRWQGIDERYEFKFLRKDGSPLWVIVSSKALFDKKGKFTGSMSMLTDITGRKEAEAKLRETLDNLEEKVKERTVQLEKAYRSLEESEKRLAEAQRMARLGNWEWNIATDKVYWSDETYRIFGLKPQEFELTFSIFLDYVHPDDREYVNNVIKRALNGEPYSIDFRIILSEGEERTVHAQGEAVFDEKNIPVRIKGTVQDITESKLAQQKIQQSEERYRSFIENFKGIAFQADENFVPVFLHGTVEEITGYSEEEFMSKQRWKDIIHPEDLPNIYEEEERVRNSPYRASGEVDFRITRKDGKIKWVHEIYQKIPGKNGIPDKYQGAIYDITERKEAEEALAKIDRIRIKEIHHRIKNNLQVISSLLDLQAETFSQLETCKTPEVVQAFMESQSRVISMALIHEELYKGDRIDTLDFSAYLRKLTAELFGSYSLRNKNIGLKLDLEQVYLGLDTAIPLGIIVNELVSNAFKHAFPAGREGEIGINLRKTESAAQRYVSCPDKSCMEKGRFDYIFTVVDNGRGIPEGIDLENTDSLGLQLVSLLVEQIGGCVEVKSDKGTQFTIWFNNTET